MEIGYSERSTHFWKVKYDLHKTIFEKNISHKLRHKYIFESFFFLLVIENNKSRCFVPASNWSREQNSIGVLFTAILSPLLIRKTLVEKTVEFNKFMFKKQFPYTKKIST